MFPGLRRNPLMVSSFQSRTRAYPCTLDPNFPKIPKILIAFVDADALALFRSRGSPASFPSPPFERTLAAMSVQPSAVSHKPTLYMVLYCLTPPRFHRYSSLTLCLPRPAWGELQHGAEDRGIILLAGGIRLVNTLRPRRACRVSAARRPGHRFHGHLTTGHWS